MEDLKTFKYRNISLFIISVIFAFLLSSYEPFHRILLGLGGLGYVGALIAGILFVSTFTVTTGIVILLVLSQQYSAFEIGIIAGVGAVIGDFTIFRFVQNDLLGELKLIYNKFDKDDHFKKVLHSKYFSWTFPVLGAIIIASPLPDEIGVSLMGIARMKKSRFVVLSFILNATGIFLVISAAKIIKP